MVKEVKVNTLVETLQKELDSCSHYLIAEVDGNLMVFLSHGFLKYWTVREETPNILDQPLDRGWGREDWIINVGYNSLKLPFNLFVGWSFRVVRTREWDMLALRDQLDRVIFLYEQPHPLMLIKG